MKTHDAQTLQLMQYLFNGYDFAPCENTALYTHVLNRTDVVPAIYARVRKDSTRAHVYTPPSLLVTSGPVFHRSLDSLLDGARIDINRYMQRLYETIKDVPAELGNYLVFHLLVHNAHILYGANVPHYVRMADEEGVTIPLQPASKVLAFEVSMVAYHAEDHKDFELGSALVLKAEPAEQN